MTFKEFMQENGYDLITTFWGDFSIADKYGIAGVKDTYKRAFNEWKDDYKFFTELTLVLNHKIWQHYESNRELAALYDRLWREADEYAMNNFKGEELDYYYRVIDCGTNNDMFLAIAALANNTDLGQWLIVTDATGDRWVKCEEFRFRGDAGCITWRKATVDEIIEHFKNR